MNIRKPIVAGQFYPSSAEGTCAAIDEYLSAEVEVDALPKTIVGGIVPHAGWVCSGAVAGKVFKAIQLRQQVEVFVLFGATHHAGITKPSVYPQGSWQTPLGRVEVDQALAELVSGSKGSISFRADPSDHQFEHSLEVQVPFIQKLFPQARILPVLVPAIPAAETVGREVARVVNEAKVKGVCVGSSDLTHYGPSYRFTPEGLGPNGVRWAKEVNDRDLLSLIRSMEPLAALDYALQNQAACGAGAIAASIAYALECGATTAKLLEHTTSCEVLGKRFGDRSDDSVGYAGVVFGKD